MRSSVIDQCVCRNQPIPSRKSERAEKLCSARPFWMIKGKEIISFGISLHIQVAALNCREHIAVPDSDHYPDGFLLEGGNGQV